MQKDDYYLVEVVCAFLEDYESRPVKNAAVLSTYCLLSKRIGVLFPKYKADDYRISDLETMRPLFSRRVLIAIESIRSTHDLSQQVGQPDEIHILLGYLERDGFL